MYIIIDRILTLKGIVCVWYLTTQPTYSSNTLTWPLEGNPDTPILDLPGDPGELNPPLPAIGLPMQPTPYSIYMYKNQNGKIILEI